VDVLVIVLDTVVITAVALGDSMIVDDSMTVDPADVTCEVWTIVVVDWSLVCWLDDRWLDEEADEDVGETEDEDDADADEDAEDVPVDKLTCLFSTFANAASVSAAGTADTERIARRRKVVHRYILISVYV